MFRAYITVPDFDPHIVELLNSHDISVTVHPEGMERPGEIELCGLVADYDILIIGVKEKMSKTVFDSVDELKILGTLSVGTDHISDEFFSSSIPVINIAGYNALSVAEFIFGQILSLYKGIWSS
ncbi:hypothetical protein KC573_02685, partial [candidate division WWE3 bacterium]|nr:hypothetical protein [candidate division WWE3 bacterium]